MNYFRQNGKLFTAVRRIADYNVSLQGKTAVLMAGCNVPHLPHHSESGSASPRARTEQNDALEPLAVDFCQSGVEALKN
jgi:hypothetical protein